MTECNRITWQPLIAFHTSSCGEGVVKVEKERGNGIIVRDVSFKNNNDPLITPRNILLVSLVGL